MAKTMIAVGAFVALLVPATSALAGDLQDHATQEPVFAVSDDPTLAPGDFPLGLLIDNGDETGIPAESDALTIQFAGLTG